MDQLAVFQYKNSNWVSVTHVVMVHRRAGTEKLAESVKTHCQEVLTTRPGWGLRPARLNREAVRLLRDVRQLETEHIHVFEG